MRIVFPMFIGFLLLALSWLAWRDVAVICLSATQAPNPALMLPFQCHDFMEDEWLSCTLSPLDLSCEAAPRDHRHPGALTCDPIVAETHEDDMMMLHETSSEPPRTGFFVFSLPKISLPQAVLDIFRPPIS
jgi:hypothetical protein